MCFFSQILFQPSPFLPILIIITFKRHSNLAKYKSAKIICLLLFEDDGRKVASIDTDGHNQRMLIWDWNVREIIATSQVYVIFNIRQWIF